MKYLLLALFSLSSLMAKEDPKMVELMAKINKLESIRQEITEKEKRIDELNEQGPKLCRSIIDGYEEEQRKAIWKETNRLEQFISHALNNNINPQDAVKEPLCPDLTAHRNEFDRLQNMIVRICVEYFFLHRLYQHYAELSAEICKIQSESAIN